MLAPPALYIPRHSRGTPFKRGRCRRDACTVMYSPNAVAPHQQPLAVLTIFFPALLPVYYPLTTWQNVLHPLGYEDLKRR